MITIKYIKGDATKPHGLGKKLIIHCCNSIDCWGSGFVIALSKRWPEPEIEYHNWYKNGKDFKLGNINVVQVEPDIYVANMIGQRGVGMQNGIPPISYDAIEWCLDRVYMWCKPNNASVHAPRFGSDRAGGDWNIIESIIIEKLCKRNIPVTIYDFVEKSVKFKPFSLDRMR